MSTYPLLIVDGDDAQGVVRAGSDDDYGLVALGTLMSVIDEAGTVGYRAASMSHEELASAVAALADQVRLLAGEMYQMSRGVMLGRVAVVHGDD